MKINKYSQTNLIVLAISVLVLLTYDLILAKYAFPLTEGWWELFARESGGKALYKEIFIGLPPLYIGFIEILQKITSNFYDLRILFIVLHLAEFLLLVFFIKKFFSIKVAINSALISELLIISYNSAYLPKDYHLFLSVFVILTLIFLVQYQHGENKYKNIFFAGIATGLILLTKQNIGALLVISTLIIILFNIKNIIYFVKYLIIYMLAISSILFIYTYINGVNWIDVYLGNDSKGSILKVLTRFISEDITRLTGIQLFILLFFYKILKSKNLIYDKYNFLIEKIPSNFLFYIKKYWIYGIYIYFLYLGLRVSQNKDFSIAGSLIFTIIIVNLFILINIDKGKCFLVKIGAIGMVILLLCYGNSMTAGYNYVGLQIGVAMLFAIILQFAEKINIKFFFIYSLLCVTIITNNFIKTRIKGDGNAYSWWGYSIDGASKNDHQFENSYLDGIKLSLETKEIFERVDQIISSTNNSNRFYFYPNIPIFYYIFDLPVHTRYPILWFDVIPSSKKLDVLRDFNEILPDYVFWLKPSAQVYSGHFDLKDSSSVISELDNEIEEMLSIGKYKQIYVRPMGFSARNSGSALRPTSVSLICNSCDVDSLNKWLTRGDIINIEYLNNNNKDYYLNIKFKNGRSYIDFSEKFNPIILSRDRFIFTILKKS